MHKVWVWCRGPRRLQTLKAPHRDCSPAHTHPPPDLPVQLCRSPHWLQIFASSPGITYPHSKQKWKGQEHKAFYWSSGFLPPEGKPRADTLPLYLALNRVNHMSWNRSPSCNPNARTEWWEGGGYSVKVRQMVDGCIQAKWTDYRLNLLSLI